jgi:hypothetical protein
LFPLLLGVVVVVLDARLVFLLVVAGLGLGLVHGVESMAAFPSR